MYLEGRLSQACTRDTPSPTRTHPYPDITNAYSMSDALLYMFTDSLVSDSITHAFPRRKWSQPGLKDINCTKCLVMWTGTSINKKGTRKRYIR